MQNAVLQKIHNHTATTRTFYFQVERPLRYQPGQFIELDVGHKPVDERGNKRWLTLSSSPTEEQLAITTHIDLENSSSFKRALGKLQPGDPVTISEAMGDFTLPLQPETPLVFVAAGIGATPMRSMIQYLNDQQELRNIIMHYVTRTEEDILFRQLFESYCDDFQIHPTTGHAGSSHSRESTIEPVMGTLTAPAMAEALIYISGPEHFVESFYKTCRARGIPDQRVLRDYFHGYAS